MGLTSERVISCEPIPSETKAFWKKLAENHQMSYPGKEFPGRPLLGQVKLGLGSGDRFPTELA